MKKFYNMNNLFKYIINLLLSIVYKLCSGHNFEKWAV